jgi:hypothetical protein
MPFLGQHFCIMPCERSFASSKALSVHRARSAACRKRWGEYLAQDARNMAIQEGLQNPLLANLDVLGHQMGPGGNDVAEHERPEVAPGFDNELAFQYAGDDYEDLPQLNYGDGGVSDSMVDAEEVNPELVVDPPADVPERNYENLNPSMDDTDRNVEVELYEGAAWITGQVEAPFSALLRSQLAVGLNNVFYPFAGAKEWELGCWMHNSGLSRRQMDAFLRLNYVSTRASSHP